MARECGAMSTPSPDRAAMGSTQCRRSQRAHRVTPEVRSERRIAMPERDGATEPAWVGEVLGFWFEELSSEDWFRMDAALDERIRTRFLDLHLAMRWAPLAAALASPRTALATVIVLDQFPRNMFRGAAGAFAADEAARKVADAAVERGYDQELTLRGRHFLYLPFEHSESAADQERSVALISSLGDAELTRYAVAHKVIIDRFGRFPHRNAALGRTSTSEELAFLATPASSF
jgi:uncharacterized protein (DUF924 family)